MKKICYIFILFFFYSDWVYFSCYYSYLSFYFSDSFDYFFSESIVGSHLTHIAAIHLQRSDNLIFDF